MEFDKEDDNKLWLQLWAKKRGNIAMKVDIIPQELANKNPFGKVRDLPNHNPQLPQLEGRLELSFNPIKMFNLGPVL